MGVTNLNSDNSWIQNVKIKNRINHPKSVKISFLFLFEPFPPPFFFSRSLCVFSSCFSRYKPPSKYNDIALFKLFEKVRFNEFVRPACLNTNDDEEFLFKRGIATGWGKENYGNEFIIIIIVVVYPAPRTPAK